MLPALSPVHDRLRQTLTPRPRPPRESDRVRRATPAALNRAIDRQTDRNITRYAAMSEPRIRERIRALDGQWDVERMQQLYATVMALGGLWLAQRSDRRWLALPVLANALLAQQALLGWCPTLPALRHLGVRSRGEIDREKFALLSLLDAGSGRH